MNTKKSGGKAFAEIEKAIERFAVAFGKGCMIVMAKVLWPGIKRAADNPVLYGQLVFLSLPVCFLLAYGGHYLIFLWLLFPWPLTPEVMVLLTGYPFIFHFAAVFLAIHVFGLLAAGIGPYGQLKAFQRALDALGLATGTGEAPKVLGIYPKEKGEVVRIKSFGVGPERYKAKRDDLQSATGKVVGKIARSKNDPTILEIHLTEKELPHKVEFKEVVGEVSRPWQFVVGESLSSGTLLARLEELPHLLIAGVTGSGKSNFLNALLTALLMKSKRLTIYGIDLKIVELTPYKKFPNFSVDTTLADALGTLKKVKREMTSRYGKILGPKGAREIDPERDNLDRIVVVVDECSDLFGKVERSSEDFKVASECRQIADELARKGRAAGIHLILATQRVSTQTLDSRILANIGGKVCFRMTSVANSVLVLNSKAAFDLPNIPGRAYWSHGTTLEQVQVPYIDKETVERAAELASYEGLEKKQKQEPREDKQIGKNN